MKKKGEMQALERRKKKRHLVAAMGVGVGGRNGRVEEEVTRGLGTS